MPAIAAANVTYTDQSIYSDTIAGEPPRRTNLVKVVFGDGALTYPTNGIPLTVSGLGLLSFVEKVRIIDTSLATNTHLWTYDILHNTLRGYSAEATELTGAVVATTLIVEAVGF